MHVIVTNNWMIKYLYQEWVPTIGVHTNQLLATYLAKYFSAKALIGIDDNDTRSVSLIRDRQGWHTESTYCVSSSSLPPHQCSVNSSNWKLRHESECIHSSNMQILFHELQNRIQVLCDQFRGIYIQQVTWQSHYVLQWDSTIICDQ